MTHVFIVNSQTFKIHLEYLFAGTGAGDVATDFIFDPTVVVGTQDEKRSVAMISDIARIRIGDKIIFFVTGIAKFYGIFEAASEFFVDENDEDNYLHRELGKKLTYRILIKPYRVFQRGISEFDFLDRLEGLAHPDEICWSLIYRKLGGNRGCTMITDAEYKLFEQKLSVGNKELTAEYFSFDVTNSVIVANDKTLTYGGRQLDVTNNLKTNLLSKYRSKRAFEHYLQLFIILRLKRNDFVGLLHTEGNVTWIGNEVMCSVGEHRIDVLAMQEGTAHVDISIIELKDEKVYQNIENQLASYVLWIKDYIVPYYLRLNKTITVHPVVISDGIPTARSSTKKQLDNVESHVKAYDWSSYTCNGVNISSTEIVHFNDNNGNLIVIR